VEVGKSLACKDRCEDDVRQLDTMIERNIRSSAELTTVSSSAARAFRQARTASVGGALFQFAFGSAFLWWGYQSYVDDGEIGIALAIGVLMTIYGLFLLARNLHPSAMEAFPPGHCQKCGYNLRGNVTGKCPECARPI